MSVKLVAIDLDDTLLNPDLSISTENSMAVKAAIDAGVAVVLASGRTFFSMKPYADALGLAKKDCPIICSNGAEIRHSTSGELIRHFTIPSQNGKIIVEELLSRGLAVQSYEDNWIICTEPNSFTFVDSKLTGLMIKKAETIDELYSKPRSKFLSSGKPEYLSELAVILKEKFAEIAEIVITKPYFLEVLPVGVDKGEALAWLAGEMRIAQEEVMAIGDAQNDLGMVSWAGYGSAPSDAISSVIEAAKHVSALPHDKSAVADLINRLVLAKK